MDVLFRASANLFRRDRVRRVAVARPRPAAVRVDQRLRFSSTWRTSWQWPSCASDPLTGCRSTAAQPFRRRRGYANRRAASRGACSRHALRCGARRCRGTGRADRFGSGRGRGHSGGTFERRRPVPRATTADSGHSLSISKRLSEPAAGSLRGRAGDAARIALPGTSSRARGAADARPLSRRHGGMHAAGAIVFFTGNTGNTPFEGEACCRSRPTAPRRPRTSSTR